MTEQTPQETLEELLAERNGYGPGFPCMIDLSADRADALRSVLAERDALRPGKEIGDKLLAGRDRQIEALRAEVERLRNELDRPKHEVLRQLADVVERYEQYKARAEKAEAALREVDTFLERSAFVDKEIVSTCRLSPQSIANYRVAGLMYVNRHGLGWVVRTLHAALRAPAPDEQPKV
jgi:hypothetical protein